ncbi:MAG: hypothetical protein MUE85_18425 [Microscillaceae bacterium]|jgi:hypothetical protein|nr:hypothetical protein [Microscillaceae bacterium]
MDNWKKLAHGYKDKIKEFEELRDSWKTNQKDIKLKQLQIYIWTEYATDSEMQQIAEYTSQIYIKQKQKYGQHLGVVVKIISKEDHNKKIANRGAGYGNSEAWVRIAQGSNGAGGESVVFGDEKKDVRFVNNYVYYDRTNYSAFSLYNTAYQVAHEALHQLIILAIFYTYGRQKLSVYRSTESLFGFSSKNSDSHYNEVVNLNMDGKILDSRQPYQPSPKLRDTETIIPNHFYLLEKYLLV